MHYVYVLFSAGFERHYVGKAKDVDKRLVEHNSGKNQATRAFRLWVVIHTEIYETEPEARSREKYLKTAAGRRWRKNNI